MTDMELSVSLTGTDIIALLHSVQSLATFSEALPSSITVDGRKQKVTPDWLDKWVVTCKRDLIAYWGDNREGFINFNKRGIIKFKIHNFPRNAKAVLNLLSPLPWTIAAFNSIHRSWYAPDDMYTGSGFSDMHFSHGWGCAFRGEGHQRLVSRRWLEFGPWYLLRGSNDTSLVQFHDLDVDVTTALKQAKLGHERMGISSIGGYIQSNYVYTHKVDGLYEPHQHKLKIVVHGRNISQEEMLDACAVRYYQALGSTQPVDSIAYIFVEEAKAQEHLHELWLRELECWAIHKGREVQLDPEYHPSPNKPEWVRHLEGEAT